MRSGPGALPEPAFGQIQYRTAQNQRLFERFLKSILQFSGCVPGLIGNFVYRKNVKPELKPEPFYEKKFSPDSVSFVPLRAGLLFFRERP